LVLLFRAGIRQVIIKYFLIMFNNLFHLGYQRNAKEAFGFFIAYAFFFFLFYLLTGLILGIISEIYWYTPSELIVGIGTALGVLLERIVSIFFLFIFFNKKKMPGTRGVIFTGIFLGLVGLLFGFLPLLVPVSYLTTVPEGKIKEPKKEEEKKDKEKLIKNDRIAKIFLVLFVLFSVIFLFLFYHFIVTLDRILVEIL